MQTERCSWCLAPLPSPTRFYLQKAHSRSSDSSSEAVSSKSSSAASCSVCKYTARVVADFSITLQQAERLWMDFMNPLGKVEQFPQFQNANIPKEDESSTDEEDNTSDHAGKFQSL